MTLSIIINSLWRKYSSYTSYFCVSVDPNSITFECQRLWKIHGFLFNLTWILPDQLLLGNVIDEFEVVLKLTGGTDNISSTLIDNSTIPFQNRKVS